MATWTWTPWTSPPSSVNYGTLCFAGDATGQYIIAGNANDGGDPASIYYSNDSGVTWNATTSSSYGISGNVIAVASSADGSIMYAVTSTVVYQSLGSYGVSWTVLGTPITYGTGFSGICCNSSGKNVVVVSSTLIWSCSDPTVSGGFWTAGNAGNLIGDFRGVACTPSGSYYVALASDSGTAKGIYGTSDPSGFWSLNSPAISSQTWTSVACSSDGSTFIACSRGISSNSSGRVYVNNNITTSGQWTQIPGDALAYINVAVNNTGTRFYACTNNGLYYGNSLGLTLDTTTTSIGNVTSVYLYPTGIHNGLPLALSVYGGSGTVYGLRTASYFSPTPICFKEGSKILCLIDGVEKYIPIESMTPGTLVKTSLNGYKSVAVIGFSKVYNPGNGTKSIHHLVKCTPANYPELTEDLILTGAHSILVDNITDTQRADLIELAGRIFITDDKYRLMACLDDRSEPYDIEGLFTIWHFALENTQYTWNYGIYANGLLVETTSLRMIKEFSGMTLLS